VNLEKQCGPVDLDGPGSQAQKIYVVGIIAGSECVESVRGAGRRGQAYEAEVIDVVENTPDPDVAEVTTKEVEEDDVPFEIFGRPLEALNRQNRCTMKAFRFSRTWRTIVCG
jgi:hypothetical protein